MFRTKKEGRNAMLWKYMPVALACLVFAGSPFWCSVYVSADSGSDAAGKQELASYLKQPLSGLDAYFSDLSEATWVMGITDRANEQLRFLSSDGTSVTGIVLYACESPYSLCGVRTDMSLDDAEETLEQQGFAYMQPAAHKSYDGPVYYDGERNFVSIWEDENGYLGAELAAIGWGAHTDRQEAAFYMGKTMEQVAEDLSGLTVQTEGDRISLQKDGIAFSGSGRDLSDTCVSRIDISGTDCEYCLYGVVPGDTWESISSIGFEEGGSGECFDPAGNLFVFYYSMSTEADGEPRLYLTSD